MALYSTNDIDILSKKWEDIEKEVINARENLGLVQSTSDKKDIHNVIIEFAKTNKRKIYGGIAINLLIIEKNKKDAIYTDPKTIPDIDMYSPEPIEDLKKICNILHKKGFKYIMGREAQHDETYTIFVDNAVYCDISYMPKNIYNRIPFKEINGLYVTHPTFINIDYLRMLSDPLTSYWRFGAELKGFRRFVALQKHYQMPHVNSSINLEENDAFKKMAINIIYKFIKNRNTIVNIGFLGYNYALKESKILENKDKKSSKFKYLEIPYFEMISTNYRTDFLNLMDMLQSDGLLAQKITHIEYYPFYDFVGFSVKIFIDNQLVAIIYDSKKKCIPFQDFKYYEPALPENNSTDNIRLGSFAVIMLYIFINIIKYRVNEDKDASQIFFTLVSHLIELRNFYFTKYKKNFLSESFFKEFIINCVGETITPERKRKLLIESRKKKNHRISYSYDPATPHEDKHKIMFANSSGNEINNSKNLRLSKDIELYNINEDDEEENIEENTEENTEETNEHVDT
jgi:hypothetical protein